MLRVAVDLPHVAERGDVDDGDLGPVARGAQVVAEPLELLGAAAAAPG